MGIAGSDVSLNIIELLGLPNNFRGVVVESVSPGGPAADSELLAVAETRRRNDDALIDIRADIITAINDQPISGMNGLITYLARHTDPGQVITVTVLRDGARQIKIPLTLGSR